MNRTEYGYDVKLMNTKPKNLSVGGMIKGKDSYQAGMERVRYDMDHDTVFAKLPNGSLVIPRVHVPIIKKEFSCVTGKKINEGLIPVLLQPGELIIHPDKAQKVLQFMKKKKMQFPLKDKRII